MTSTHLEERVRTLLESRMLDEPAPPTLAEVTATCARDLRRHRRRTTLAATALVAVVGATPVGIAALTGRGAQRAASDHVTRLTDAQIIERCRDGNQSAQMTAFMYASGTPTIRAEATVAQVLRVILVSADKQYWADCFVNLYGHAEFGAGMTVQNITDTSTDIGYSAGFTCRDPDGPPAPPCPTFFVAYVDRLLPPVAAVRFRTADGATTTVPTHDGFVLFTHTDAVPAGFSQTEETADQPYLERITYLDSNGEQLAAQNMGTSDPDKMQVGDLPLLSVYPSQRSGPVGVDPSGHGPDRTRPSH